MTEQTEHIDEDMSWMTNPAPPPRALDPAMDRRAARPAEKAAPAKKPAGKQQLRPLEALADDLEHAPEGFAADDLPEDLPEDPAPAPAAERPRRDAPPPPRDRGRPRGEIWEGCPVKALGVNGEISYFLDALGQLRGVTKIERSKIMHLFGHLYDQLCWNFPQWSAPSAEGEPPKRKPGKFEADAAAAVMTMAAAEKGLIDPDRVVRGVGAWPDEDGGLIYHAGDRIWRGGKSQEPARIGDYIYPSAPAIPAPANAHTEDPIPPLREVLSTWLWGRPKLDVLAALGMVGCQMMGGAMLWRVQFWLTGPKSSGKSDLQKLLEALQGGEYGVIKIEDATPASIAGALRISTLPVALDELEATDNGSQKEKGIVEIMRIASSGGSRTRSDPKQGVTRMVLRSSFVASSIIIPGVLSPQDKSRLVILDLHPFKGGEKKPDLSGKMWRQRGAAIKRRLIDRWPTWDDRLTLWRKAFQEHRFAARDEDNWATICAMADMMEAEALPSAARLEEIAQLVVDHVKGTLDHGSDAEQVITHLLGQIYDPWRKGTQFTLGQWLMVAGDLDHAPAALRTSLAGGNTDPNRTDREVAAAAANAMLAPLLIRACKDREGGKPVLFVGNTKVPPLNQLFRDTIWYGGAWPQSLARIPGAYTKVGEKYCSRTLAGTSTKGVEVPFASLPGLAVFPQDRLPSTPSSSAEDAEEQWV